MFYATGQAFKSAIARVEPAARCVRCKFFCVTCNRRRGIVAEDTAMKKDLDDSILNCLEGHTFLTFGEIFSEVTKKTGKTGGADGQFSDGTLRNRLRDLQKQGKIRHQKEGYVIDRGWKEGTPKAFILIELAHQKRREDYQKKLADEIRDGFSRGDHQGLSLISEHRDGGGVFADRPGLWRRPAFHRAVRERLPAHPRPITKTRTIMVWPTEPRSPA